MSGGRGEWEARQGPISGCVPHCDRAGLGVDCNHIRLKHPRAGWWIDGKWVAWDWVFGIWKGDIRSPKVPENTAGRDADIRRRYEAEETQERIAKLYKLNQGTVSRVLNGNHQRPLGRYGEGGRKSPNPAERARLWRELHELSSAQRQRHEAIRSGEEPRYSTGSFIGETRKPHYWRMHSPRDWKICTLP
jgi:hypothetical protein